MATAYPAPRDQAAPVHTGVTYDPLLDTTAATAADAVRQIPDRLGARGHDASDVAVAEP